MGDTVRFACPECGRKYATKPELAGKKIRCGGCGKGVRVPGTPPDDAPASRPALRTFGAPDPQPPQARRPPAAPDPVDDAPGGGIPLLDALSDEAPPAPRSTAAREAGGVLPSRSEAMEQVRRNVAEKEAAETKTAAKKKKRKKKKGSGYFDPKDVLMLVGGVAAVVAVLGGVAWASPDFRFPIGGVLCVVGFIVYLLGFAALRQRVAEEGAFQVLLFRFFPPYQWYFVARNWSETRDYVAFFCAGLVVLAMGGVIIKTSPVGKEAMKSEAAYQKTRNGPAEEGPPAAVTAESDDDGE